MVCLRAYTFSYFHDLLLNFDFCLSAVHADDGTVHTHDKNIATIEIKLQGDLNNAKHWSKENKLGVKKTNFHSIITKPHV